MDRMTESENLEGTEFSIIKLTLPYLIILSLLFLS
jgi:hypothetical protein